MAQGASSPTTQKESKLYYVGRNARPAFPADLAAVAALVIPGNLMTHVQPGFTFPAAGGAAATPNNFEWEEIGEESIQYTTGLIPAPTGDESSVTVTYRQDERNSVQESLRDATPNTWAILVLDMRTDAGDNTIGIAAGNAEGTLAVAIVQHGASSLTVAGPNTREIVFRYADSSDSTPKQVDYFDYGQP